MKERVARLQEDMNKEIKRQLFQEKRNKLAKPEILHSVFRIVCTGVAILHTFSIGHDFRLFVIHLYSLTTDVNLYTPRRLRCLAYRLNSVTSTNLSASWSVYIHAYKHMHTPLPSTQRNNSHRTIDYCTAYAYVCNRINSDYLLNKS